MVRPDEPHPHRPAEVRLTNETVEYLRDHMRDAVTHGLRSALCDQDALRLFWASAFESLRAQATEKTGRAVLDSLFGFVSRLLMFLVLGSIVFKFGGWDALAAWSKSVFR